MTHITFRASCDAKNEKDFVNAESLLQKISLFLCNQNYFDVAFIHSGSFFISGKCFGIREMFSWAEKIPRLLFLFWQDFLRTAKETTAESNRLFSFLFPLDFPFKENLKNCIRKTQNTACTKQPLRFIKELHWIHFSILTWHNREVWLAPRQPYHYRWYKAVFLGCVQCKKILQCLDKG